MFEVYHDENGRWWWRLIDSQKRPIVYSQNSFDNNQEAAKAANNWRQGFWKVADCVDHRQARCI